MEQTEVLIIGSGIAGCITALELADQGINVFLVSAGKKGEESSTQLAQGGVIYQGYLDSPDLLYADIIRAGCGLSYEPAVSLFVEQGPSLVKELLVDRYGVPFDRGVDGKLALTGEAAHSISRILFSKDQTGKVISEILCKSVAQHPNIKWSCQYSAVDLVTLSHHSQRLSDIYQPLTCVGAYLLDHLTGDVKICFAQETILATGGLGEIYLHTTNPRQIRGDGLAMAYRAGARIMNMEYVQFHPTALFDSTERRFLLSETLRGEGGEILNANQSRFMNSYHPKGSLAPRDVVARAIYQEMLSSESQHLWLDISHRDPSFLKHRFPNIFEHCLKSGYDITSQPLPVVPAAHYLCGGVAVDDLSRTTIQRLRAVGEVACTGLHGANRLASTSLLEALVWGKRCAEDVGRQLSGKIFDFPPVAKWVMSHEKVDLALIQQDWMTIKQTMWNYVGLIRDGARLTRAHKILQELKTEVESFYERCRLTPELLGLRNGVQVALLVTQGAMRNRRSIGCHYRIS